MLINKKRISCKIYCEVIVINPKCRLLYWQIKRIPCKNMFLDYYKKSSILNAMLINKTEYPVKYMVTWL